MGSVFKRRRRYYIKYRHPTKGWITRSAGTEDEDEALAMLARIEAEIEASAERQGGEPSTAETVEAEAGVRLRDLVPSWLHERREVGQRNVSNEEIHSVDVKIVAA